MCHMAETFSQAEKYCVQDMSILYVRSITSIIGIDWIRGDIQ